MMDDSDSERIPIPTLDDYAMQLEIARAWDAEIAKPRHADPKRLLRHGFKIYSQNDEDGIIQEIFRRIGAGSRTFVEFGVATGFECNTVKLLIEGWQARNATPTANIATVTFEDGRTLFAGSSNPAARQQ